MFCPTCRDEFRKGFTHCGRCNVDLVDQLDAVADEAEEAQARAENLSAVIPMVDYCGFFDLPEARVARDRVREINIHCEIVIREHPGAPLNEPAAEEFWLRVEHSRYRQANALLQADEPPAASDEKVSCPACGADVPRQEKFCPDCGIALEG